LAELTKIQQQVCLVDLDVAVCKELKRSVDCLLGVVEIFGDDAHASSPPVEGDGLGNGRLVLVVS
jgi:hypothetical protein